MRSFKSNENIHKKEGGSYYVFLANKASSVTLQSDASLIKRSRQIFRRKWNLRYGVIQNLATLEAFIAPA